MLASTMVGVKKGKKRRPSKLEQKQRRRQQRELLRVERQKPVSLNNVILNCFNE
jgi:hypothetical protein